MSRTILNGWKEISNYLERGVRTAQRWEALGMPVHRPALKDRSAVVAFAGELDAWIARGGSPEEHQTLVRVRENAGLLAWHTKELATRTRLLQKQIKRSLETCGRVPHPVQQSPALRRAAGQAAMLPFRRKSDATLS